MADKPLNLGELLTPITVASHLLLAGLMGPLNDLHWPALDFHLNAVLKSCPQTSHHLKNVVNSHFVTIHLPTTLLSRQCIPVDLGFSVGATFSNVSLKEVAQRRSISFQTSEFILVRRCRSRKCPEAKTERRRRK